MLVATWKVFQRRRRRDDVDDGTGVSTTSPDGGELPGLGDLGALVEGPVGVGLVDAELDARLERRADLAVLLRPARIRCALVDIIVKIAYVAHDS